MLKKATGEVDDQEDGEETNAIVNEEESGNTHYKVPKANHTSGDEEEAHFPNPRADNYFTIPSNTH